MPHEQRCRIAAVTGPTWTMRLFTLFASGVFTLCGIVMIAAGNWSVWWPTAFFALCFLVAIFEPWFPKPPVDGDGLAVRQDEPRPVHWIRTLFWRKTIDDLMAEMKAGTRSVILGDEIDLAREYERRQLPSTLRFPKEGEVYEALTNFEVDYMTSHHAPFTGGGRAVLPQGERVRVASVSQEKPIGVYCDPLRYDELHHEIVSEQERDNPYYDGYYFSIKTVDLNKYFRLVDGGQGITNG